MKETTPDTKCVTGIKSHWELTVLLAEPLRRVKCIYQGCLHTSSSFFPKFYLIFALQIKCKFIEPAQPFYQPRVLSVTS